MPHSPAFWTLVYLAELALVSFALGCLSLRAPRLLMIPRLSRFLTGFCLAPFFLALWVLLASVIFPGFSRLFFLLPPSIIAALVLLRHAGSSIRSGGRWIRRTRNGSAGLLPACLAYACAGVLVFSVLSKLVANGAVPVTGSDAIQYLGYSLRLAQGRSFSSISGHNDSPDGAMIGDMHGPVWHAYLSHAQMTTGINPLGYPNDHAVRVAFQITVVYMLLAVAALAAASGGLGVAPLAIILLLQVPQYEYISIGSSRDAFRIIPLVLLAAVLSGLSPSRLRSKLRFAALIPVAALSAFSLAGHTLGGMVVLAIGLAWTIWSLAAGSGWKKIALVLLAMGAGLVMGGTQYIRIYLEVGRLPGAGYLHDMAIKGTPLQEAMDGWNKHRMRGVSEILHKAAALLARDQCRLSLAGLVACLCAIACRPQFMRRKKTLMIPFVGLATLVLALPFTGLLDIGFDFSGWFIRNVRYSLHWYPFAAVCAAMLLWRAYHRLQAGSRRCLRVMAGTGMAGVILAGTVSAHGVIVSKWRTCPGAEKRISAIVHPLKAVLKLLPPGKKLLVDSDSLNYYLGNQAIVMYTRPAWDVTLAKDIDQAQDALRALNIGAVALTFAPYTGYWMNMPLLDLLSNPEHAMPMADIPESSMKVFTLNHALPIRICAETAFPITLPSTAIRCDHLRDGKDMPYDWISRGFRGFFWVKKGDGDPGAIQILAGTPNEKGEHILLLSPRAENNKGFPLLTGAERALFTCEMRCVGAPDAGCGSVTLRMDVYSARNGWRYYPMRVNADEDWRRFDAAVLLPRDALFVYPTLTVNKPAKDCVLELRAPALRWFSYDAHAR